jgi:uncharacterized protein
MFKAATKFSKDTVDGQEHSHGEHAWRSRSKRTPSMCTFALPAIVLALAGLLLAGCSDSPRSTVVGSTSAGTAVATDTITVVGEATVRVPPDEATLTLAVESDGNDPAAAMNKNSGALSAVLERIKHEGVGDDDVVTSNVSVYAIRTYTDTGEERLTGYRAANSVTVTLKDTKKVGQVLSAAIEAGANSVSGPVWGLTDETDAVAEALTEAAHNAKKKAEALADSLDVRLGAVVMMSENSVQAPIYPLYSDSSLAKADAAGAVAETPISGGNLEIVATVTVTFALRH